MNTVYYAVTNHFVIIPLRVVNKEFIEDMIQITTEIVGATDSYKECHHRHFFKLMWLNENNLPDKINVFITESEAREYALKELNKAIIEKQQELNKLIEIYLTFEK